MNISGNIYKFLSVVLTVLLCFSLVSNFMSNREKTRLESELFESSAREVNIRAASDSIREVSDGLFAKLSFVLSDNEMAEEEIRDLKTSLKGKTVQIMKMSAQIEEMKGSSGKIEPKISTAKPGKIQEHFEYNYSDSAKIYSIDMRADVMSEMKPSYFKMDYLLKFNPIKVQIYTKKLSDLEYEVYAKALTPGVDIIELNNYVLKLPADKKPAPIAKNFNFGVGAGVSDYAYLVASAKYKNHSVSVTYQTKQSLIGAQYIFWAR